MPNLERFVTLELPDSLAINPVRAGHVERLNERLHAWQGVGVAKAADAVVALIGAAADMMMGHPRVVGHLRAKRQGAVADVGSLEP
jgi:hypothetical protein